MSESGEQLVTVEPAERDTGVLVLAVTGEIDYTSAGTLDSRVRELLDRQTSHLVLDFSEVGFCDSSGMSALIRLWQDLQAAGGQLAVAAAPTNVTRALRIGGLQNLIATYPTVDEARGAAR